jgi:hypothetical protein
MTVADIQPERALVVKQVLPNGSLATWAFLLLPQDGASTRLVASLPPSTSLAT